MKPRPLELDAETGRAAVCGRLAMVIRELRLGLGLTQAEVVAHARICERMMRYLEQGRINATGDVLDRIARALDLDYHELVFLAEWVGRWEREQGISPVTGKIVP